jgi:hypothetical protein
MNNEQTIKALEIISQMPTKPNVFPVPTCYDKDQFVNVGRTVADYAKKVGYKMKLDDRGKMHFDDYKLMLEKLELDNVGPIAITFEPEENKL